MTVVQPELGFVLDEDAATRVAIVDDLGDTMFVEAGAGSGKTKSLVDRVVALVTRAGVPMREIAAVTFTEKAAAELRDRIRRELERAALSGDTRARAALDELDGAAVSTLHAFAQRLLSENPIEAGLPAHRCARRHRVTSGLRGSLDASWISCSTILRSSAHCSSR